MYDKSTNFLKINPIFGEYFHQNSKGYVQELNLGSLRLR